MAIGMQSQLDRLAYDLFRQPLKRGDYPFFRSFFRNSATWYKTQKRRRERRRAKADPECIPQYRKFKGYE